MRNLYNWVILIGLFILVGCQKREARPLEEFYSYAKVARIVVEPSSAEYVMFASKPIKINIHAFDDKGGQVYVPDTLLQLSLNNTLTKLREISPADTGKYVLKARFGGIESAPVNVVAKDIIKSLKIVLSRPAFYLREETDPVMISVDLIDKENKPIPLQDSTVLKLFVDNQALNTRAFKPAQAKTYQLRAKIRDHESPIATLVAYEPNTVARHLKVEVSSLGGTTLGNAESEGSFEFKAIVYDKDMKILPFSKEIKYYANGSALNTNSFPVAGTYRITASGYGQNSNNTIDIKIRPKLTYPVVKIPLILHLINQPAPSVAEMTNQLMLVNQAFRNQRPTTLSKDPNAVDFYIEFEWATRAPDGKLLERPGIHLVNGPKEEYLESEFLATGGICWNNFWNPNQYLNVWVGKVKEVKWAGMGSLPYISDVPAASPPQFMVGTWVSSIDYLGVLTHELGHNFGLNHTFSEVGNLTERCRIDSDGCPDTPNYSLPDSYTDKYRTSCEGAVFTSTNYMDYGIGHFNSFTYDQRTLARNTIEKAIWLPTPRNRSLRIRSGEAPPKLAPPILITCGETFVR